MIDDTQLLLRALLGAATILAAAYLSFVLIQWIARRYSDRYPGLISLVDAIRRPFRILVAFVAARLVSSLINDVNDDWVDTVDHILQIGVIASLAWLAIAIVGAVEQQIINNDRQRHRSSIDQRRFETQISLLRRLVVASIVAIAVVAILLTFPSVRSIGTTLIASAGLISIVAGLAAQTSLTNVFAGIQLALSDTVRVGDVIVVNSQIGTDTTDTLGTVTQLTLTHVEMRLWDNRVLILPSVYFISQPFQNLTRSRSLLVGTVTVDVDWSTPIDTIRAEVSKILAGTELWDGRREFVQVSSSMGATRQLLVGMSAKNMDDLVALQALVREKLTDYLMQELPESLVRTRTEPISRPEPESPSHDKE